MNLMAKRIQLPTNRIQRQREITSYWVASKAVRRAMFPAPQMDISLTKALSHQHNSPWFIAKIQELRDLNRKRL